MGEGATSTPILAISGEIAVPNHLGHTVAGTLGVMSIKQERRGDRDTTGKGRGDEENDESGAEEKLHDEDLASRN